MGIELTTVIDSRLRTQDENVRHVSDPDHQRHLFARGRLDGYRLQARPAIVFFSCFLYCLFDIGLVSTVITIAALRVQRMTNP